MTLEDILKKTVGLPLDFTDRKEVLYSCPCSRERIIRAIVALGEKEIKDIIEKGEEIEIQCEFCKNLFIFSLEELRSILENMR